MMLGRTVHELTETMTGEEFGHWQAFLEQEPLPAPHLARHAELLSAMANGPLTREDRRNWRAADFMPPLWAPTAPDEPPAGPSIHEIQAAVGDWFRN